MCEDHKDMISQSMKDEITQDDHNQDHKNEKKAGCFVIKFSNNVCFEMRNKWQKTPKNAKKRIYFRAIVVFSISIAQKGESQTRVKPWKLI